MELQTKITKVMDLEFNDKSEKYKSIIGNVGRLKTLLKEEDPMIILYDSSYIKTTPIKFLDENSNTVEVYTENSIYILEK